MAVWLPWRLLVPIIACCPTTATALENNNVEIRDAVPNQNYSYTILDTAPAPQITLRLDGRSDITVNLSQPIPSHCRVQTTIKDHQSNVIAYSYYYTPTPVTPKFEIAGDSSERYALSAGDYDITFSCMWYEWPHPDAGLPFSFSYTALPLPELPSEALSFRRWLADTRINTHVSMTGFYYVDDDQKVSVNTSPWVSKVEAEHASAVLQGIYRTHDEKSRPKISRLLVLNSPDGKDGFLDFERAVAALLDEDTFLHKLLRTAAGFSGKPISNVAVALSTYCLSGTSYFQGSKFIDGGSICFSASVSENLPDLGIKLGSGSSVPLASDTDPIGNFVKRLEQYFADQKATFKIVDREADYLEFLATGMQGLVIPGNADWERLQVTLALLGSGNNRRLRVGADGFLGAGLRPPTSYIGYDRSMEPQYSEALTLFVRSLATQLKSFGKPLD